MKRKSGRIWTVARIATSLKEPTHRIKYVIRTRGITPLDRIGITLVYSDSSVERIQSELSRMERRDDGRAA